ncbi:MAG: 1,4-alpha-glucan branching protein GlgB [Thermoflavifilum sp.]|nr:1,4-alpha-glucan branching protein GlgB [Thermoflavifilum sp.]
MTAKPSSDTHRPEIVAASRISDFDVSLFQAGKHYRMYEKLGCHPGVHEGRAGAFFAVWAPYAEQVSVVGSFNDWQPHTHPLHPRWDHSGIWEGFIPHVKVGDMYKFFIRSRDGEIFYKGDPYAFHWEKRPHTASIVWSLDYAWQDDEWMNKRHAYNNLHCPFTVYEVHLGSWRRPDPYNHEVFYNYREIADQLVPYVRDMGFTHVELMPVMEHPFDGSWGYQITGYFAPTSRYGTPQDFMYLIDRFHQAEIGVILDWVPSHFPADAHGLFRFDGSHVYEYADMRKGFQKDWNSYIFNYARNEVRCFLLSNALFWLDKYHIDGLRVDAVASMIYLDYSKKEGEWVPNEHGGRENLEAISLLQELNTLVYGQYPGTQTIAEESTAFYGVSKPVYLGGLGFGMKWMMGWMNDTLEYFKRDPYFRQFHHDQLTFSLVYAFSENFMLPLSHDEVVHGKSPMIYKMPGDDWQKFANLRLLYAYMFTHPGAKLLFMGNEIAQTSEWNFKGQLDWHLLQYSLHQGIQKLVKQLNTLYRQYTALHETQFMPIGFEWIDIGDRQHSIFIYSRHETDGYRKLLIALNMTPVPRLNYEIGMAEEGAWQELLNTDDPAFGGSGVMNPGVHVTHKQPCKGKPYQLIIDLPPLGAVIMERTINQ